MAELINIQNPKPRFNDNLLPSTYSLDIISGGANVEVTQSAISFNKDQSIKLRSINTGGANNVVFNLQDYSVTIPKDGNYAFSVRAFAEDETVAWDIEFKIFINGLDTYTSSINSENLGGFNHGIWNTYGQAYAFNAGDIVTFRIDANADTSLDIMYLSAFKLELLDKGFGIPSIFSYPKDKYIDKGAQQYGFYNYQHAGGTQAIPATTWTDIVNDGGGALTSTDCGYADVDIYDTSTNLMSFNGLSICDGIVARFQATSVTTTVNNQSVKVRVLLSVGSLNVALPFFYEEYDASGVQDTVFGDVPIYILSELTRTFPAKFQIWSSHACTLNMTGGGFNLKVQKRLL